MKLVHQHSRLPPGVTRKQTMMPAGARHNRLAGILTRSFNVVASIVLVVLSSFVMARLIKSDPDSATTFAPFYVIILFLIGGFLFAGRGGKWVTVKVIIQMLFIFVAIPLCLFVSLAHLANSPAPVSPRDQLFVTNALPERIVVPH
jgi:hypothetical protein